MKNKTNRLTIGWPDDMSEVADQYKVLWKSVTGQFISKERIYILMARDGFQATAEKVEKLKRIFSNLNTIQ